jgi:biopolymer transport protein ExbD
MSEVIAIRIDETGMISVQNREVDIRAVRANIESELATKPEAAVVVISDRDADAGLLVRVIDQARVAGAEKVSLAAMAR